MYRYKAVGVDTYHWFSLGVGAHFFCWLRAMQHDVCCTLLWLAMWKHWSQMKFISGGVSVVVLVPAVCLLSRDGVGLQPCVILPGSGLSPASFPLTGSWAIGAWRTAMVWVMVMSRKKKATCTPESPYSRKHPQRGQRRYSLCSPHWTPLLLCPCTVSLLHLGCSLLCTQLIEWDWKEDTQPSLLHLPLLHVILCWLQSRQIQSLPFEI